MSLSLELALTPYRAIFGPALAISKFKTKVQGPADTMETLNAHLKAESFRRNLWQEALEDPESCLTDEQKGMISDLLNNSNPVFSGLKEATDRIVSKDWRGKEHRAGIKGLLNIMQYDSLERNYADALKKIEGVRALNESMDAVGRESARTRKSLSKLPSDAPPLYEASDSGIYRIVENVQTKDSRPSKENTGEEDDESSGAHIAGDIASNDQSVRVQSPVPLGQEYSNVSEGSPEEKLDDLLHTLAQATFAQPSPVAGLSLDAQKTLAGIAAAGAGLGGIATSLNSIWNFRAMVAAETTLELTKKRQDLELQKLNVEIKKIDLEAQKIEIELQQLKDRSAQDQSNTSNGGVVTQSGRRADAGASEAAGFDLDIKKLTVERLKLEIAGLQTQTGDCHATIDESQALGANERLINEDAIATAVAAAAPAIASAGEFATNGSRDVQEMQGTGSELQPAVVNAISRSLGAQTTGDDLTAPLNRDQVLVDSDNNDYESDDEIFYDALESLDANIAAVEDAGVSDFRKGSSINGGGAIETTQVHPVIESPSSMVSSLHGVGNHDDIPLIQLASLPRDVTSV